MAEICLSCKLPKDMIELDIRVKTLQGMFIFKNNQDTKSSSILGPNKSNHTRDLAGIAGRYLHIYQPEKGEGL